MWKQRVKSFICCHLVIFAAYIQNDKEDFQHIGTDVQKVVWQNSCKMLTLTNAENPIILQIGGREEWHDHTGDMLLFMGIYHLAKENFSLA